MATDQTGDLDTYCPSSKTGRHSGDDRAVGRRTGTCRYCGATIHRTYARSSWWWVDWAQHDETKPRTKQDG